MLETVIAIPLFILLIGGMYWISDLIHTKQTLVVADRYVAWNRGNRHRGAPTTNEVRNAYWIGDMNKSVFFNLFAGAPPRWSYCAFGGVQGAVDRPAWLAGWVGINDIMGGKNVPANVSDQLFGRDIALGLSGMYEGHQVVMRSGNDGSRNDSFNTDAPLTIGWSAITAEGWPDQYLTNNLSGGPLPAPAQPPYIRYDPYVQWSE